MNEKTIIIINLILQCVLFVTLLAAGYLARFRHKLKLHCLMMRVAIPAPDSIYCRDHVARHARVYSTGQPDPAFQYCDDYSSCLGIGGSCIMGIYQPCVSGNIERSG